MEPTQTPQTNAVDAQQGQPLFTDEPAVEQSAEIQNKEHAYRDQIQQFFRAPVVEGELPAQPAKLIPEDAVTSKPVGEPLFAEPIVTAPDVTPMENIFQKLVEDHIATGNMNPVEDEVQNTDVLKESEAIHTTAEETSQTVHEESLLQKDTDIHGEKKETESAIKTTDQHNEHITVDTQEKIVPEVHVSHADVQPEFSYENQEIEESIPEEHTEPMQGEIMHGQEEDLKEQEEIIEEETSFPSFSFGQETTGVGEEEQVASEISSPQDEEILEIEKTQIAPEELHAVEEMEKKVVLTPPETLQETEQTNATPQDNEKINEVVVEKNSVLPDVVTEEQEIVVPHEESSDPVDEVHTEDNKTVEPVSFGEEHEDEDTLENTVLLEEADTLETQLRLGGWEWLYEEFAAIDPQKALEKREYSKEELARAESAFHAYVAERRAQTVDFGDANEEFAAFTELFLMSELLEHVEDPTLVTEQQALMKQQIQDDFFLLQDARPVRYILEYVLGKHTEHSQVEYTPYIDYRVTAKRPLLVYMLLDLLMSCLPTQNPAFLLTVKDEIYQDRKKYVRFSLECASHSKIQKRYHEVQPLLKNILQTLRARFGMRVTDVSLEMVIDIPFVVKKGE